MLRFEMEHFGQSFRYYYCRRDIQQVVRQPLKCRFISNLVSLLNVAFQNVVDKGLDIGLVVTYGKKFGDKKSKTCYFTKFLSFSMHYFPIINQRNISPKKQKKIFMADKKIQHHENSNDYANQRKEAVPQFLVIVSNAIKQQVVPPQNESSSNRFVNDFIMSLRESYSSDDFNGTEVIHVKPKIIEEVFALFVAAIRDARHDIIK